MERSVLLSAVEEVEEGPRLKPQGAEGVQELPDLRLFDTPWKSGGQGRFAAGAGSRFGMPTRAAERLNQLIQQGGGHPRIVGAGSVRVKARCDRIEGRTGAAARAPRSERGAPGGRRG